MAGTVTVTPKLKHGFPKTHLADAPLYMGPFMSVHVLCVEKIHCRQQAHIISSPLLMYEKTSLPGGGARGAGVLLRLKKWIGHDLSKASKLQANVLFHVKQQ